MNPQPRDINVIEESHIQGWTEARLTDTPKFIDLVNTHGLNFKWKEITPTTLDEVILLALDAGVSKEDLKLYLKMSAKSMFKENKIWGVVKKYADMDMRIPLLFGQWTDSVIKRNTITTIGKQASAQQIGGTTVTPMTAIAIGVGTPSATALGSESTTNGGSRGAATVSNQTTTLTGDTERWVKTFTFSGSLALTEEGIFDNNASGGNMLASQTFSAVNVVNTDTLTITHNVKYA